ncbi:MAG: OsmC family protein [Actinobacteria bacterium]|nr:OsmC family protein [Actinomycetota bacterium]
MDSTTLREMQAPLKQQYRDEPTSALTPLQATGSFDDPGITCTVDSWAGPVRAGLHPAAGGDGSDACSGDMLLQALLACAGVTMRSVATALGIDIRSAKLHAHGQFDARGTLGISRDVPVGADDIQLIAELDTDADDQAIARLAALTERYCVVAQSLAEPPTLRIQRTATATAG